MQCPRCQRKNPPDAKFCNRCGIPLAETGPAKAYAELKDENELLRRSLGEAQQQETATSEILRAISEAQTDAQPVLDAIARSTVRLCEAARSTVWRPEGDLFRAVARCAMTPEGHVVSAPRGEALDADSLPSRAIREREILRVNDVPENPTVPPEYRERARIRGYRSLMAVPMVREGRAVGAITVVRPTAAEFSDQQVGLVKTFADQAVIAIENVRLFKETKEALERQTATSEILRVISQSPTDVQPVFETIVRNATKLCDGTFSAVFRWDGALLDFAAAHNWTEQAVEAMRAYYPIPATRATGSGRAILDRAVVQITDIEQDPEYQGTVALAVGFRSGLFVPMLREGTPVGAISVGRATTGPFSNSHVELLKTFADQAVIAIENVRLFKELETRNTELTETLARQIATSEVLRAISQAQTDAQPVFDIIARSARRLCGAAYGQVQLYDGALIHLATLDSAHPEGDQAIRAVYPLRVGDGSAGGRAIAARTVVQIPDLLDDRAYAFKRAWEASGLRSLLAVPMLRDGEPIGTIGVGRTEPGPFPQTQVDLLRTFADQAVIAIENVRLFRELEARTQELTRSVDELTALGEVGLALSSTLDLEAVLQTIATRATLLTETAGCVIWEYDKPSEEFRLRVSHYTDDTDASILPARGGVTTILRGQGLTTQVMEERQAVQIPDITVEGAYESPVRKPLIDAGHRALLGVPLLSEDEVIGVLAVTRKTPGRFEPETVRLLSTFATQSALAIQNARLFHEIEVKSRQLEAASQHKSEFLANMSHELRTPLNAIIGFSEVLTDRMFGELNEKQEEYLKDIYASGTHLLSLINDILDLSKIEAGRMELELSEFDLPTALDNALMLIRERAQRRSLTLHKNVDTGIGQIQGDERKIRQVVLNLLSNAIKFTPEAGRIELAAMPKDDLVEVSVSDTGVGIAPEDQEKVFEEFRQVGTAEKKAEGTGLGLTLCRKFIELHGGKIGVKSGVGQGSTFTFTIPVRHGERARPHSR